MAIEELQQCEADLAAEAKGARWACIACVSVTLLAAAAAAVLKSHQWSYRACATRGRLAPPSSFLRSASKSPRAEASLPALTLAEDEELRTHYGARWRRPPSSELTRVLRDKANGYRSNLDVAGESDKRCVEGSMEGGM